MSNKFMKTQCSITALAAAMWIAPAEAQTAAALPGATATSSPPSDASADVASSGDGLGDIIVTARRRAEASQSVPQAIVAFNQGMLAEAHVQSAIDLGKAVPGLNASASSGNAANVYYSIRGRGFNYGASTGSTETYFADVPLSSPFQMPQLPPELFDLDSVQVLKGPQGTLFGRNTTGGAVVLVPKAPTSRFEGYARIQGGTYGSIQGEAAVNVPLGDDVALRVAGFAWKRNGYMHNVYTGPDPVSGSQITPFDFMSRNVQQIRGSLRVDLGPNLHNTIIVTYTRDKSINGEAAGLNAIGVGNPNGLGAFETPTFGSRTQVIQQDYRTRRATAVWAAINTTAFDVAPEITLKNIAAYISGKGDGNAPTTVFGFPGVNFQILVAPREPRNRQFTEEFQVQGKTSDGKFDWTLGGLYDQTRQSRNPSKINFQTYSYQIDHYAAVYQATNIDSYSLYGSAAYKFADKFDLSAGYRHTWDHVDTTGAQQNSIAGPVDLCPAQPVTVATATCAPSVPGYRFKQKFEGNAVNVTLAYHPADRTMVYAGYRLGYKRGGVNPTSGSIDTLAFGGEKIDSFTLGLKTENTIGGIRTRLNVEGYYDLYKNQQVSYTAFIPALNGFAAQTTNVPKSRYRGFDVDLVADVTPWMTLTANYAFLDASYLKFPDPTAPAGTTPADLSVNPVAFASRNKFAISARLHEELPNDAGEIVATPRVSYQSREYSVPTGLLSPVGAFGTNGQITQGAGFVPGYSLLDFRLEWNRLLGSRFNAAFNVTNLTDKVYYLGEGSTFPFGFSTYGYGEPRMITFELSTKF